MEPHRRSDRTEALDFLLLIASTRFRLSQNRPAAGATYWSIPFLVVAALHGLPSRLSLAQLTYPPSVAGPDMRRTRPDR